MKSKASRLSALGPLVARAAELFRHGDHAGAEALCRSALAADPRSGAALHLLGVLALHRQDIAQALQYLESALKFSPRDAFLLIDCARVHEAKGDADQVLRFLGKAETVARNVPVVLLAAAAGCERLNALDRAEALYRRVTVLAPDMVEAWIGLGNVRARSNRLTEAEASYRKAEALQPAHPDLLGNLGNLAQARGDPSAAESFYRRAIAADPRNAIANYNLAQLLFESGRAEEAYTRFATATTLQPEFVEPAIRLAALTADRGHLRQALEMYARIMQLHPACFEARYCFGITLLALDRTDEAMAHFQRFALECPEAEPAHAGLGAAFMHLGRLDKAEQAFRAALGCDAASLEARLDLLDVLYHLGREAEAEALIQQALTDDSVALNRGIAEVHYYSARFSKALSYYEALLRLDPADAAADARIGEIRLLRGELGPAAWAGRAEWARRMRERGGDSPVQPLPDLDSLLNPNGQGLLLKAEQGIGDELFFLRFARIAAARGLRVFFQASDKLAHLLKPRSPSFAEVYGPQESPPSVAASIPITDLPVLLRHPELTDRFPLPVPLTAAHDRLAEMSERLARLGPAPYIGVTWRAGASESKLAWVSRGVRAISKKIGPARLGAALRGMAGTVFVLQRFPEPDDLREFQLGLGRPAPDLSAVNEDLESMLALLSLLDEYVGVSNTNMHLMAGLGHRARVLVSCPPEWRWMEAGDESPWFPGFRIYRQAPTGDWSTALSALRGDLIGDGQASASHIRRKISAPLDDSST